jgi:hypothetical protein
VSLEARTVAGLDQLGVDGHLHRIFVCGRERGEQVFRVGRGGGGSEGGEWAL